MKSTGIVRNTDKVGRIVLPIELRQTLYIAEGDPLEIYTEEDKIILKKYNPSCIFCGSTEEMLSYKGKSFWKPPAKRWIGSRPDGGPKRLNRYRPKRRRASS